jgi:hypothetical protein
VTVSRARGPRAKGTLVRKLEADPDWRAAAFLLERGPARQRWGKSEEMTSAPVSIQLSNEQLTALVEGLRYVQARNVTPPIEAQAASGSGETPPKR